LDRLFKGKERPIAEKIATRYIHSLIIFTNPEYTEWHFTNLKYERYEKERFAAKTVFRSFRRIIVGKDERLRAASERLALLEVEDKDSPLIVHAKCNRALDVQEVTKEFYRDFVTLYKNFRQALKETNMLSDTDADALTQNIFNRLFSSISYRKRTFSVKIPNISMKILKTATRNITGIFYFPYSANFPTPTSKMRGLRTSHF
jgi:hypothetical protein